MIQTLFLLCTPCSQECLMEVQLVENNGLLAQHVDIWIYIAPEISPSSPSLQQDHDVQGTRRKIIIYLNMVVAIFDLELKMGIILDIVGLSSQHSV